MDHFQYDSTLEISEDGTEFIIKNKKPEINPQYIYDETPDELRNEYEEYKAAKLRGKDFKFTSKDNKGLYKIV